MRKNPLISLFPLILLFAAQTFAQTSTGAINIADYGVVGDGSTCDEDAFQDAIDDALDGTRIVVPSNFNVKICDTINIWGRRGLTIGAEELGGTYNAPTRPGILWGGSSGGTMFSVINSGSITIQNLSFQASGSAQADVMIDIDQKSSGYPSGTCTDTTVDRVLFNANTADADLVGIRIAYTSANNCEQMRLTRNSFLFGGTNYAERSNTSRGIGIKIGDLTQGGGLNAKNVQVEKCYWLGVRHGVDSFGGVVSAKDNESNFAAIDYKFHAVGRSYVASHYSETQRQFLVVIGGDIVMTSNEIHGFEGWDASYPVVAATGASYITSTNNYFDPQSNAQAFSGGGSNEQTGLVSINDVLPNITRTGYTTFARGYTAIGGTAQPSTQTALSLNTPIHYDLSTVSSTSGTRLYKQALNYDASNGRFQFGELGTDNYFPGRILVGSNSTSANEFRVQGGVRLGDITNGFSYSIVRNSGNGDLEFEGTQSGFNNFRFKVGAVRMDGPAAIGGTSPNSIDALRLQGSLRLGDVNSGYTYSIARSSSSGNLEFDGTQSGYINYHFKTGNVGIGTAPTANALEVNGTTATTVFSLGGGVTWSKGSGAPTGSCTTGSFYSRTGGGSGVPALYVCENSAWVAK
jgi:hypothetical protein